MTEQDDPRARFRRLPERVRPEEMRTEDVELQVARDAEPEPVWRAAYLGGGLP
jgi:hypothetical protein